jgi:hypothetical protein
MASYTPRVKEILARHNRCFDRQGKGDHEIWFSPITNRKFPADGNIKSRALANVVPRQAGIRVERID